MDSQQPQQLALSENRKRKVLAHYVNLRSTIQRLKSQAAHGGLHANVQTFDLAALDEHIKGFGEYLSSHLEPSYYNEHRLPDSTAAVEVFHIPELLEMILDFTHFIDILHMSETCHSIRDIIYASSKLQVRLYLKPTEQRNDSQLVVYSPFPRWGPTLGHYFEGYLMEINIDRVDSSSEVVFQSNFLPMDFFARMWFGKIDEGHGKPRIGKGWTDMTLCQPNIRRIEVSSEYSGYHWPHSESHIDAVPEIYHSKSGFTLGQLLALAKEVFARGHPCCDAAGMKDHDVTMALFRK